MTEDGGGAEGAGDVDEAAPEKWAAFGKAGTAYENALAELKTKAPDEWERYVSSMAEYERMRTGYQNAQTMLEAHENADESQKAKPHEKAWGKALEEKTAELKAEMAYENAWKRLKAAAPNKLAAHSAANRALMLRCS